MKSTTVKKRIPASDLPAEWREQGGFAPDEQVRVLVEPDDPELAAASSLKEVMNVIGKRAEQRAQEQGMTPQDLTNIIDEER